MKSLTRAILNHAPLTPLCEQTEGGSLPALITGLSGVHRAHLAAALHLGTERPLVVVCADESAAEPLCRDLEAFLGIVPTLLTGREFTFLSAEGVSRRTEQKRLRALCAMAREESPVTVATVSALLQRTVAPEKLQKWLFTLCDGEDYAPDTIEDALLRFGYVRADQVEGPGQYARRGGILDIFSPEYDAPVRCEFWGDTIDSMGFFDVSSQRRTEQLKECRVLPAAEVLPSLYPGGSAALGDELMRLAGRINKQNKKFDVERLIATLREDAERLCETGGISTADRYLALIAPEMRTALDYIPADALLVLDQPLKIAERADGFIKQTREDVQLLMESGTLLGALAEFYLPWEEAVERLGDFALVMADAFTVGRYPLEPKSIAGITAKQLNAYAGSTDTAIGDVSHYLSRGFRVVVLTGDERRAGILKDMFAQREVRATVTAELNRLPEYGQCVITPGGFTAGFEYPDIKLAVLTETQLLVSASRRKSRKKAISGAERLNSYADLSVGDLVVHEYHGIGRFAGIFKMPVDGAEKDYIKICYAGTDSLYVPATQLDLVSKYIGAGEDRPVKLSKMGGAEWHRTKTRAKAAAKELAHGLVQLYAERRKKRGYAFSPDNPWQREFEDNFGYSETDDQLRCIAEIKKDMESEAPMDRLLCGDVGFGKTEVALRAVMKCVMDGKQAAILVPTTVLAQQHYQTAVQRFFGFPVTIQVLNRFRTAGQTRKILEELHAGRVDIIIGTHRLLQKDVHFKDLGLLIVDEEQRFGVSHKERLKEMCRQVDVLSLSATPIPRTLNMALSGLRDMSAIEEPPQDRLPVQTFVMEHDWNVVCDAIRREVQRGGQVYYLHNRVESIERVASRLSRMLEGITVAVAHGKMDEATLSAAMESVQNGETQVLVCTTIIETGIDIPNVNTLIIEDADKLGLAQLHQLRGRVGRSNRRASAYLTFRRDKVLTEIAEKRLSAIREFAEFNSGFRIAMRDLEIRGAGNLLGAEQSGHMMDVGYDMYLKLLEEAVLEEKGEKPPVRAECAADLAVSANIPELYIPSPEQRMDLYRRIALIRTEEEADDLTDELIDRFGDPPSSVNALIHVALLRGEATRAGICDISQKAGFLRFKLTDFDMERISALYAQTAFKGRVKVEAGTEPCVSLRLVAKNRVIDEARAFIAAYKATEKEAPQP